MGREQLVLPDVPAYTRLWDVALALEVQPDTLRRDLRLGRIRADRPGREYLFTPEQLEVARAYYAAQAAGEGS